MWSANGAGGSAATPTSAVTARSRVRRQCRQSACQDPDLPVGLVISTSLSMPRASLPPRRARRKVGRTSLGGDGRAGVLLGRASVPGLGAELVAELDEHVAGNRLVLGDLLGS